MELTLDVNCHPLWPHTIGTCEKTPRWTVQYRSVEFIIRSCWNIELREAVAFLGSHYDTLVNSQFLSKRNKQGAIEGAKAGFGRSYFWSHSINSKICNLCWEEDECDDPRWLTDGSGDYCIKCRHFPKTETFERCHVCTKVLQPKQHCNSYKYFDYIAKVAEKNGMTRRVCSDWVEEKSFCSRSCALASLVRTLELKKTAPGFYSSKQWKRLKAQAVARDGLRCVYCNEQKTEAELTADHVIPRSQGGPDELYNLVACCLTCNLAKGNKKAFAAANGRKISL